MRLEKTTSREKKKMMFGAVSRTPTQFSGKESKNLDFCRKVKSTKDFPDGLWNKNPNFNYKHKTKQMNKMGA